MFQAELTYGALLWTVFRTKILIVNSKSLFSFSPKRCVSNYSFKTFMINMPLTSVICGFSNNWAKIISSIHKSVQNDSKIYMLNFFIPYGMMQYVHLFWCPVLTQP